jgi:hypothetical protein
MESHRVLHTYIFIYISLILGFGRAIALVLTRSLLTAESSFNPRVVLVRMPWTNWRIGGPSTNTLVSLTKCHSIRVHYSSSFMGYNSAIRKFYLLNLGVVTVFLLNLPGVSFTLKTERSSPRFACSTSGNTWSFKFKREFSSLSSINQLVWTCLRWQVMTCLNLQPALVGSLSASNIRCNQDGRARSTQQCCAAYNYQISKEGRCPSFWNLYQASSTVWRWMFVTAKGVQLGEIVSRKTRPCWKWTSRSATKNFVNPDNVLKIGERIRANRRITVLELLQEVGISVGSVEESLHNELKVSRVSASWVPRLLSPEHRERRLVAVTQLLQRYEREGAEFVDSIVTCDETWVHYFTPESKTASK